MSTDKLYGASRRKSRSELKSNPLLHSSSSSIKRSTSDISADILFKMSKKIAQLTKVIYYLNTKNEDHSLEIQNMVDAYELEIAEVIEEGTRMIDDARLKWTESELKFKTQEDMIATYLETVKSQKLELNSVRESEKSLQEQLACAKRLAKTPELAISDLSSSKQDLESRILSITSQYEQKIKAIKLEWTSEVEDLQNEHTKKVRAITEEKQKNDDQVEEESIKYQSEIRRLKLSFEEQETKSKMEYVELEKKLQEAMLDNQKQFAERDSAISELQNLSAEKDSHIQDLENKSDDLKKALTESAEKVSRLLVDKTTEQEKNNELFQKNRKLENKLEDILSKLAVSEQQIREAEIAYQQSNNQIKSLEEEVALVSDDLIKSNEKIDRFIEQVQLFEETIQNLNIQTSIKDTKIVGLEEDLQALEQKRIEDLKEAVEKLTKTMEADKIDSIAALKSNMESSQKEAELLKLEEMKLLSNKICSMQSEFEMTIQQSNCLFEQERSSLNSQIVELKENLLNTEKDVERLTKNYNLKCAEAAQHVVSIQNLMATVNTLEVDKADLFQKMVHIDRQIRAEMFEKFQKEKGDLEILWRNQHHTDIQNLKDTINQDHEQELQTTVYKIKGYHAEEVNNINKTNQAKVEGFLAEMTEKEQEMNQLRQEKEHLQETLETEKYLQTEVLAKLETDHINGLAHQKQRLEELMKQKENDLSIASACAISDLEKQHATTLAESEITHKKQLDDLRNFHTVSALSSKKEFETQRQIEISRLKTMHSDQMASLIQERTKMLSDLEADLSAKMKSEIEKVVKKWTLIVQAREDQIQTQSEDIIAKQEQINLLKQQIQVLESNLAGALKKLSDTIALMETNGAESRKILEESVIQFEADLQKEIELVKTEHVRELQIMLQDFEKAKLFLKKQISLQAKQLQDADIKYINREPRDVDIQTISELKQQIDGQKEKISSLLGELNYFKREMNNRDATFNKIFSKTPIVGVMQPMTLAQKKAKIREKTELSQSHQKLPPLFLNSSNEGTPTDFSISFV
ncbi:hypothetical protein BDV3_006292 [Batrachochytrium dendrobatidis]